MKVSNLVAILSKTQERLDSEINVTSLSFEDGKVIVKPSKGGCKACSEKKEVKAKK